MLRRLCRAILGLGGGEPTEVRPTADGFEAFAGSSLIGTVRWGAVRSVSAAWCGGVGGESIELTFLLDGGPRQVRVAETVDGWEAMEAGMLAAFPPIPRDWRHDVKCPPRWPAVPSVTVLYER